MEAVIIKNQYHKLTKEEIKKAKEKIKLFYGLSPAGVPKCETSLKTLRQKILVSPLSKGKLVVVNY